MMYSLSGSGIKLLTEFEGFRKDKYKDIVGRDTIGYGTLWKPGMPNTCTEEQAEQWLREGVAWAEKSINSYVNVPINQNRFDALVCIIYNIGAGAFISSTLLRFLNNRDYAAAADEFLRWNKAGGQIQPGLLKRRYAERELFVKSIA